MEEYELLIDVVAMSTAFGEGRSPTPKGKYLEVLVGIPEEGKEYITELRDPARMGRIKVRATFFSKPPDEMPDTDKVWLVRADSGRFPQPWAVRIVERIEEVEEEIKALPTRKLSMGERKGRLLEELLKEREAKKKG